MRSFLPEHELITPKHLPDALHVLASGEGWRPIAGGTDLMVLFNAGKLSCRKLASVGALEDLRRIEVTADRISIGSAVTYSEIRNHAILQSEFHLLCQSASWTGSIANQNRGTLGGNIANASPAADSAPALLAYDAELELKSTHESRLVPYAAFHLGYKQIDLRDDELIVKAHLPRSKFELRQHGRKVGPRKAQAIAKVSIAATSIVENDTIVDIRIAMGSVAPIPLRCKQTEEILRGRRLTPELQTHSQETLLREIRPISDIRSTSAYRATVAANLLGEYLESLR
jgi:CO/xanthine dehydrogenase FAD-binding subunit